MFPVQLKFEISPNWLQSHQKSVQIKSEHYCIWHGILYLLTKKINNIQYGAKKKKIQWVAFLGEETLWPSLHLILKLWIFRDRVTSGQLRHITPVSKISKVSSWPLVFRLLYHLHRGHIRMHYSLHFLKKWYEIHSSPL